MTIEFRCPTCQKLLRTSDDKAGRMAKCPDCGNAIQVPQSQQEFDALDDDGPDEEVSSRNPPSRVVPPGAGDQDTKLCPMCGETIKAAATRCRFCGEDVGGAAQYAPVPTQMNAGEVISSSWEIYKSQMGLLIGAFLIVFLIESAVATPDVILQRMADNRAFAPGAMPMVEAISTGLSIVQIIVQCFLSAGHSIFLLKLVRGQGAEIADLFKGGPFLLRAIGNSILFGLMVAVGVFACVVPGILLALMFWPYMYVLVDTNARGVNPLGRARRLPPTTGVASSDWH